MVTTKLPDHKLFQTHAFNNMLCYRCCFLTFYLDFSSSIDEVNPVEIVFLHARCYGEDVWIKDNVTGVKSHLLNQNIVRSSTDFKFSVTLCCL